MTPDNGTPKTSAAVPPTAKLSSGLPRDIVPIGPSSGPEAPYPLKIEGPVVNGFGRGSKELNTPTANIPVEGLSVGGREDVDGGVYFGWAGLDLGKEGNEELAKSSEGNVFPMVMSIGWNPFYKNTVRSVEVHIMHTFPTDFYGTHMKLLVLGYIRTQLDYVSKEALISDIRTDIEIARVSLERKEWGVDALGGEGKWVGEF